MRSYFPETEEASKQSMRTVGKEMNKNSPPWSIDYLLYYIYLLLRDAYSLTVALLTLQEVLTAHRM